jgi:thiol-disulfide isomerase/thioredoxin
MSHNPASPAAVPLDVTADPSPAGQVWTTPRWLKAIFFWSSLALLATLAWHKYAERVRYQALLVETVMDPLPLSQPAPDFTLSDGEGGPPVSLSAFRGKYLFINFWATWCPPCRDEMPSLEFLTRKFGGAMNVIAVTADEDWGEVKRFFGDDKPAFRLLWDPKKQVTAQYGTEKFPESYVVDPQGRLILKFVGTRDWNNQAAEAYFSRLLGR